MTEKKYSVLWYFLSQFYTKLQWLIEENDKSITLYKGFTKRNILINIINNQWKPIAMK